MKKQSNFTDQKILVLPTKVVNSIKNSDFTSDLYITDIGFFPNAKHHYKERKTGCLENILILCIDGKGWVEVNGQKDYIGKYQYTIIPKNTPHKYGAVVNDPWSIYWVHFSGKKANHFVYPLDYPRIIKASENARFEERIQLFDEIYYNLEDGFNKESIEYSSVLLMHVLGSLKYLSQFRKIKEILKKDTISKAILYIKTNKHKKLYLKEIAAHCKLSVSHLCLIFKKKTSYTPIEYLIFIRIKHACFLLSFTSLKIKEIATQVGYQDAYYFTRLFKQEIGKSPSSYRSVALLT